MIPLQIVSVIFGLLMLYIVRIHTQKKHLDFIESLVWTGLWIIFIYLAIFPQTFKGVVETLHISRVFDLLVIIALMIVVFMTFQNRMQNRKLEKKIEEIVRKRTLYPQDETSKN